MYIGQCIITVPVPKIVLLNTTELITIFRCIVAIKKGAYADHV